jgi:hypothetical protein
MIGWLVPVRASALCLSSASRASNAETSPAMISRLDSFSPAPGDSEVTGHVKRLSSNETKIAPSSERIAAVFAKGRSSDIGRLQSGG